MDRFSECGSDTTAASAMSSPSSTSSTSPPAAKTSMTEFLPPCRICGGIASGFHYGANTCEACKAFFRRCTANEYHAKPCPSNGECRETVRGRLVCVSCRFTKCVAVGMTKSASKKGRYTHQLRTKYTNEIKGEADLMLPKSEPKLTMIPPGYIYLCQQKLKEINKFSEECFPELNMYMAQKSEIDARVHQLLEESYPDFNVIPTHHIYSPGSGDIQLFKEFSEKLSEATRQNEVSELLNADPLSSSTSPPEAVNILWQNWMMIAEFLFIEITKFAKLIPGFSDLSLNDRIILLKGARIEITTFMGHPSSVPERHLVGMYSALTEEIILCPIDMSPQGAFTDRFSEEHNVVMARLLKGNYTLEDMNVIMAFLIFSPDREGLADSATVESLQDEILKVLEYTLKKNHPKSQHKLAETLLLVPLLREHSEMKRKLLYAGREETNPQLPPLISEVL